MRAKYTAIIYFDDDAVARESGDDVDDLFAWMLSKAQGKFGNLHGEIIDNETKEIVRTFKHAPPD